MAAQLLISFMVRAENYYNQSLMIDCLVLNNLSTTLKEEIAGITDVKMFSPFQ